MAHGYTDYNRSFFAFNDNSINALLTTSAFCVGAGFSCADNPLPNTRTGHTIAPLAYNVFTVAFRCRIFSLRGHRGVRPQLGLPSIEPSGLPDTPINVFDVLPPARVDPTRHR